VKTMNKDMLFEAFCDPKTRHSLTQDANGLSSDENTFPLLSGSPNIIDFIDPKELEASDKENLAIYQTPVTTDIYRNFLDWLFKTFYTEEDTFRQDLLSPLRLKNGDKVLIVSCGLGDDIKIVLNQIGAEGILHTQDLSKEMVKYTASKIDADNVCFSISNGMQLPYKDDYFDAVFHFGGINLFGDVKHAIAELTRVCKVGGRVVFGDEGIAPHLKGTEYGKIVVTNNRLWGADTPLELLPENAGEVELKYMLGNCFYVISYDKLDGTPKMDMDTHHLGSRGGSPNTRYYGQLEGVTPKTKEKFLGAVKQKGISAHDLLEKIINEAL
jgi:SAM-dependent methyltransferase